MEAYITRQGSKIYLNSRSPFRSIRKCELRRVEMADDYIELSILVEESFEFQLNDKFTYEGREYFLNLIPAAQKEQRNLVRYECQFESVKYQMNKTIILNEDGQGNFTSSTFMFTGSLSEFAVLLLNNLQRTSLKWELGTVGNSPITRTMTFDNHKGLSAIEFICDAFSPQNQMYGTQKFNIEEVNNKWVINFGAIEASTPTLSFEYGRGKGLYELSRTRKEDSLITTKLYVYGSDEGITSDYRGGGSIRLRMPASQGDFLINQTMVNKYGLNEGGIIFDDIKPTIEGSLSNEIGVVNPNNDTFLLGLNNPLPMNPLEQDLDGNYLYAQYGVRPRLRFTTGQLAGKEFTLDEYLGTNQTASGAVRLRVLQDENGMKFPDPDNQNIFQFQEGDRFNLIRVKPPQSVINAAEQELYNEALDYWQGISSLLVEFTLTIDPKYFKESPVSWLDINSKLNIIDATFDVDSIVMVKELRRDCITGRYLSVKISYVIDSKFRLPPSLWATLIKQIQGNQKSFKDQLRDNNEMTILITENITNSIVEVIGDIIDDDITSATTAWSSEKIETWALNDYANRLVIKTPNIN